MWFSWEGEAVGGNGGGGDTYFWYRDYFQFGGIMNDIAMNIKQCPWLDIQPRAEAHSVTHLLLHSLFTSILSKFSVWGPTELTPTIAKPGFLSTWQLSQ